MVEFTKEQNRWRAQIGNPPNAYGGYGLTKKEAFDNLNLCLERFRLSLLVWEHLAESG